MASICLSSCCRRGSVEIEIAQQQHVGIDPDVVRPREHREAEVIGKARDGRHAFDREIV
jgi:hypothetical protein